MKWPLHIEIGAMPVRHIQLPIDEYRHAGLDPAGTLRVGRNQTVDRSVDECPFGVVEEDGQIFPLRFRGTPCVTAITAGAAAFMKSRRL
jgi:hypothetical protein